MSTRSPSKKEKPERGVPMPVQVLTRKSSVILNTRQLRRKEGSIKKISEMTQMLLTPITELTPKVRTRRSPKDKSVEKRDADKKGDLKEGVRRRGRKRGPAGRGAEAPPAAAAPAAPAGAVLTVRELVELADARELTDDDLMEILTCDSPVWWEDPPDTSYGEEPIDPEMLHEVTKCSRPAPLTITIANTKQIDYKFMKKRLKLENVLGNLKSKKNRGSSSNQTKHKTESLLHVNTIEKGVDETTAVFSIKNECKETPAAREDEGEAKRVKKSSESTEGDSIQGLSNEDMLRDLENMEIPVEAESTLTEEQIKDYAISENSQDVGMEESETSVNQSDANVARAGAADTKCSGLPHHEDKKGDVEEKSSISSAENVSSSKDRRDTSSIVSNTLSDAVSVTSYTPSNTVSDTMHSSSPNAPELPDSDIQLNSDSQHSEDDHAIDEKIECDTGVDVLKPDLSDSDSREQSDSQDCAEKEIEKFEPDAEPAENCDKNSKDDKVIEDSHVEDTAEENTSNSNSREDKINQNSQKNDGNDVHSKETDASTTKDDANIKQTNKTKKLNKEQLKAVYKTIVDISCGFVRNLNENTKTGTSTTNQNIETVGTFYKKCKNIRTNKRTGATDNETGTIDQNTNRQEIIIKEHVTEQNHDVKSTSCTCSKGSDIRSVQFSIIPDGRGRGAKYCMNCSSIFETDTCCYCEKRLLSEVPSTHPHPHSHSHSHSHSHPQPCGACSYKVL